MLRRSGLLFFVGFLSWALTAAQIPAPKICGSPKGPPVTAARIKLSDERHLAYKEHGVPKEKANYKIIFVHGFDSCRHDAVIAQTLSPVIIHLLIFICLRCTCNVNLHYKRIKSGKCCIYLQKVICHFLNVYNVKEEFPFIYIFLGLFQAFKYDILGLLSFE